MLSKQQFQAGTPGVMPWARDHHKSSGGSTSHSNTLSGCKAQARIALWQVKDKHSSYLILSSGMTCTYTESQTQVVITCEHLGAYRQKHDKESPVQLFLPNKDQSNHKTVSIFKRNLALLCSTLKLPAESESLFLYP